MLRGTFSWVGEDATFRNCSLFESSVYRDTFGRILEIVSVISRSALLSGGEEGGGANNERLVSHLGRTCMRVCTCLMKTFARRTKWNSEWRQDFGAARCVGSARLQFSLSFGVTENRVRHLVTITVFRQETKSQGRCTN